MDVFIKFWGTRGSIPTPGTRTRKFGGNTSCVEVRVGETLFILDAGSGLRELGSDLLARGKKPIVAHLLLSHSHWDHVQGFPFFAPAYVPGNEVILYGSKPGDDRYHRLLSGQMKSDYFPVDFAALNAVIRQDYLQEGGKDVAGARIETFPLNHPGGALAYSFTVGRKKVVYATDNELIFDAGKPAELRPAPPELVRFVQGADLLITDSQYTDAQYATRKGWGHSSCFSTTDLAVQAGVKMLATFHHEPANSDEEIDAMIEACRARVASHGANLVVFAAREGLELRVV